jgi:hypothetical protein
LKLGAINVILFLVPILSGKECSTIPTDWMKNVAVATRIYIVARSLTLGFFQIKFSLAYIICLTCAGTVLWIVFVSLHLLRARSLVHCALIVALSRPSPTITNIFINTTLVLI